MLPPASGNAEALSMVGMPTARLAANPLAPAEAVTREDLIRGVNVGPGIVGRVSAVGRPVPGAGVQDLEDSLSMAVADPDGVVCARVEAGLALGNGQRLAGVRAKDALDHALYTAAAVGGRAGGLCGAAGRGMCRARSSAAGGSTIIGDPCRVIRDEAATGTVPGKCAMVNTVAPAITQPAIIKIVAALVIQPGGRGGMGRRSGGEETGGQREAGKAGQGHRRDTKGMNYTTHTAENGQMLHVNLH